MVNLKKSSFMLILVFSLLSCGKNKNDNLKLNKSKPEKSFLGNRVIDSRFIEVDIDSLINFKKILDVIEDVDCKTNYALFRIETDTEIYKIKPLQSCDDILDYNLRQIVYVNTDSITVNEKLKYPIDSLELIMNNHLKNPNNDNNYPKEFERRFISINVDNTKAIIETKNLLVKIISVINRLNINPNFEFMFKSIAMIQVIEN